MVVVVGDGVDVVVATLTPTPGGEVTIGVVTGVTDTSLLAPDAARTLMTAV